MTYDFRKLNNIEFPEKFRQDMLDQTSDECRLEFPIVVITCKNREKNILKNLDQFLDTPIYVFLYETEKDLYSWLDRPNVKKIYVPEEYRSCQKMRYYVQHTMVGKEDIFWFLDDDMGSMLFWNRYTSVSTARGMRIAELLIHDYNWGMIGFNLVNLNFYFRRDEAHVMKRRCLSYFLFNNKLLTDNNLWFSGDKNVAEDDEIAIDVTRGGLDIFTFCFLYVNKLYKCGDKNSIASQINNQNNLNLCGYVKFGEDRPLKVNKYGQLSPRMDIIKLTNKQREWDDELLSAAKDKDLKSFYKLLISKKKCSSKWLKNEFPVDLLDDEDFLEYCYHKNGDPLLYKNKKILNNS